MIRVGLATAWLIAIMVAMLTPGNNFPEVNVFDLQDKFIHFICFAILSYLWCGVGVDRSKHLGFNGRLIFNFLIFGVAAGIILECLQYFIPFRTFDYWDMIINEIGGIVGLLAYFKIPLPRLDLH